MSTTPAETNPATPTPGGTELSEALFLLTACRNLLLADDRVSAIYTRLKVEQFLRGHGASPKTTLDAGA